MRPSDARTLTLDVGANEALERCTVESTIANAAAAGLTLTDSVLLALDRLAQLKVAELAAGALATEPRERLTEERNAPQHKGACSDEPRTVELPREAQPPSDRSRRTNDHERATISGSTVWYPPRRSPIAVDDDPLVVEPRRQTPPPQGKRSRLAPRRRPAVVSGRAVLGRLAALAGSPPSGGAGGIEPPAKTPNDHGTPSAEGRGREVPASEPEAAGVLGATFSERAWSRNARSMPDENAEPEPEPEPISYSAPWPDEDPDLVEPKCIAALMIDGGTRTMLDVDPGTFVQDPMVPDRVPDRMRRLFDRLRAPITAEQAKEYRKEGGRTAIMPLPQVELDGTKFVMGTVELGNFRRLDNGTVEATTMTFYVEDVVFVRIGFYSGQVCVQFKARALWAEGFQAIVTKWLHAVLWWTTGRHCDVFTAAGEGWRMTGLELCSDFVGLVFNDPDLDQFVGFAKGELIRKIKRKGLLEYMAWGTRASRTSLAIYDKDEQIAAKSKDDGGTGGDDSCYRATHFAHGWDGKAKRVRVEFRFTGQGLHLELPGGKVLDFRDPATLCDRDALRILWATICAKKRLVTGDRREAARHETDRAVESIDPRWELVCAAADMQFVFGMRQTREAQTDAWTEAEKRCRRDFHRSLERVKQLHDIEDADPAKVLEFVQSTTSTEDQQRHRSYGRNYRFKREEFIGEEIRAHGRQAWIEAMGENSATFYPTIDELLGEMLDTG